MENFRRRVYVNRKIDKDDSMPFPVEVTPSGTVYFRLPNGSLVNADKIDKKARKAAKANRRSTRGAL